MLFELQDFQTDVVEASDTTPVVIDFWADWCGPCKQLGPVLEKLASEAKDRWKLVKIDTDKDPDLAAQFNVRGIPAVKMVYQRELIAEFTGAQPDHLVRKWLVENLPETENDDEKILAEAIQLISRGNRGNALDLLKRHISDDSSDKIFSQYAMLCLPEDIPLAEKYLKKITNPGKFNFEFEALETLKYLKSIRDNGTVVTGSERVVQDYTMGINDLFNNDFENALKHFLQALGLDRSLDEDGPRKACLACFKILGEIHPLSIKYRRRFSMALY